ncbi:MAG: ATP-binding cassette domain-containing protein [Spirochaetales bacterium]|nr:ATP-binding cassette domain-containing protein [Spirochaetales bacterium]
MIDVAHVSRFFDSVKAVDDISFSIQKGEIVGLLGPNGAGKTTTMRMITGFLDPSDGSVLIDGTDTRENIRDTKRKIGYMSESAPLYGDMIASDYLEYLARLHGVDAQTRIPSLARECGITEVMHQNIATLSRGYRQRVGLAHALIHDPEILILDEPTSGLDPNQIIEVRKLIKEIGRTRTVIISTHILSEVESLCDRIIIINHGRIVADSPTAEIRTRVGNRSTVRVQMAGSKAASRLSALQRLSGVASVSSFEGESVRDAQGKEERLCGYVLSVTDDKDPRPEVFALARDNNWIIYEMALEKNSLEDVFRTLTIGGDDE